MKKLCLWALCLVAVMAGCKQKGQTAPADSSDSTAVAAVDAGIDKHSEAYIRQRLDTIYGHIRQMIAAETEDNRTYISSAFNLDSAYCSSRYYSLMKQALEITNETGDILFDYDHWVCGQDYSKDWHYKIREISDITDSTATAEMEIINFGNANDLSLSLLYERGDWYIDEFGDSVAPETDQDYFRRVISDGLKTREKAKALVGEWGWVGENCPELLLTLVMTDKGLKVKECNVYRQYGFDKTDVTFNGEQLEVTENEYDYEKHEDIRDLRLFVKFNGQGDLTGSLRIKHPQASKEYDGPITLRKGYFMYRDGVKKNLSDYAE